MYSDVPVTKSAARFALPAAIAILMAFCFGALATDAHAATFNVNSTADLPDALPGDFACRASSGKCTLRAAVMEADAYPTQDTINIAAGTYKLTIKPLLSAALPDFGDILIVQDPSRGDLNAIWPVTINGAGARNTIIDGNGVDRVFTMLAPSTIKNLTVTGGVTAARELLFITGGGGIANVSNLTLDHVTVTGNDGGDYGGGVFNVPGSNFNMISSTISNNIAGEAGGVRIDWTATIVNSTISGNTADRAHSRQPLPAGLDGFSGKGGGIDLRAWGATIKNSTIAGNYASHGGGGINVAPAYSDLFPDSVAQAFPPVPGRVELQNSIVAANSARAESANCDRVLSTYVSLGNNIDDDGSCGLTAASDLAFTNPLLGPLANNGGPTNTQALLPGSPATRAGANCLTVDQRDLPRLAPCDIGAFETQ